MSRIRKSFVASLVGGSVLTFILAGCGSGGYSGPKNQPGMTPPTITNPPTGTYGSSSHK